MCPLRAEREISLYCRVRLWAMSSGGLRQARVRILLYFANYCMQNKQKANRPLAFLERLF